MPWENGINWEPLDPQNRGRYDSFSAALSAALSGLLRDNNDFITSLTDAWPRLFPNLAAKPGRFANGILFLYVRNSSLLYSIRPRLPAIRRTILALPNAPKKLTLRLEVHSSL